MGALADKYRAKPSLAAKYRVAPESEAQAPVEELSPLAPSEPVGAAMRGIHQGGTLGFGDEMLGAFDTQQELSKRARQGIGLEAPDPSEAIPEINPNGPEIRKSWGPPQPAGKAAVIPGDDSPAPRPGLAEVYRKARDGYRADNKASQSARPLTYGAAELAGGFAVPMPGAGLMKGAPLVAKMGLGAAQAGAMGVAYGAGNSEADLTKGDTEGFKGDALERGAISAPFGAAGAAAGHGLEKLAGRFAGKASAADAKAQDIVETEAMKLFKKATGSLGGEVSAGRNADEVMAEIIASASSTPAQKRAAQSLINDPARLRMVQRVYDNAIQGFPWRMGSMMAAEKGVQDAASKNTPQALAAAKDALLADPIRKRVLPSLGGRLKRHLVPAAGTALGLGAASLAGIDPVYGLAAGQLLGQTSKQLLSHPAVQKALFSGLASSAAGASRFSEKLPGLMAAEGSLDDQIEAVANLMDSDPEAAAEVRAIAAEALKPNQSKAKSVAERFGP